MGNRILSETSKPTDRTQVSQQLEQTAEEADQTHQRAWEAGEKAEKDKITADAQKWADDHFNGIMKPSKFVEMAKEGANSLPDNHDRLQLCKAHRTV